MNGAANLAQPSHDGLGKAAGILALLHQGDALTSEVALATGMTSAQASALLVHLQRLGKVRAAQCGPVDARGRKRWVLWSAVDGAPLAAHSGTVDDIEDYDLVRRAVISAVRGGLKRSPAWSKVMDAFALGSTFSAQLCRRYGIDPDTGADIAPLLQGEGNGTG